MSKALRGSLANGNEAGLSTELKRKRQRALFAAVAAAAAVTPSVVRAADTFWNSTSNNAWATAGNWVGGVPTGTSTANFNERNQANTANVQHTIDVATVGRTTVGIHFTLFTGGSGFTFSTLSGTANPSALALNQASINGITNATIVNDDDNAQTFNWTIRMNDAAGAANGDQTWIAAAGDLIFSGILPTNATNATVNNNGGTLTIDGAFNTTIGSSAGRGNITGAGGLIKNGSGTLNLGGTLANAYTGSTVVNVGRLNALKTGALGTNTAALTVNGGILDISTFNQAVGAVIVNGGTITGSGGVISGSSFDVRSGVIGVGFGGTGTTLVKTTAGTVTMTGANTYDGATTVGLGTLVLGPGGSMGSTAISVGSGVTPDGVSGDAILSVKGNYTIGTTTGGSLSINGGNHGGSPIGQGTLSLLDGGVNTLTLANATGGATNLVLGGSAGNAAVINLDIGSASTDSISVGQLLTLNSGGAVINLNQLAGVGLATGTYNLLTFAPGSTFAGAFSLGTAAPAGSTWSLTNTGSAEQLIVTSTTVPVPAVAYWTGSQGSVWSTLSGGNSNFATSASGATNTGQVPGNITDVFFTANSANNLTTTLGSDFGVKSLTFTGTGTAAGANPVTIGGSNTLTVGTGGITVQAGAAAATITAPVALGAPQTWTNNGSNLLSVTGGVANSLNLLTVTGPGGLTIGAIGNGPGGLTKNGTGILTLSGANTYSGPTSIGGGTVNVTGTLGNTAVGVTAGTLSLQNVNAVSQNTITVNGPTAALTTTVDNAISGNASLAVQSGTATLAGANNYTGATLVSGGTLSLQAAGAIGASAISVSGTGLLVETADNAITGVSSLAVPSGTATLSFANNYTGATTVNGGTLNVSGKLGNTPVTVSAGTLSLQGSAAISTNTLIISGAGSLVETTDFAIGGNASVVVRNTTAALTRPNNYTGNTTIDAGNGNTVLITDRLGAGSGQISAATGAINPVFKLHIDGGGLIAMPNNLGFNSNISFTIDVDNNGSGSNGLIGLNKGGGAVGVGDTMHVTGNNGYGLYVAELHNTAGGATGGSVTLDPTTAGLIIGKMTGSQTGPVNWVLDGTNPNNIIQGTISNSTSGAITTVTKNNTSTWVLSGTNTYTGGTFVNGGILSVSADTNLGNAAGAIYVSSGTLLATQSFSTDRQVNLQASDSTIDVAGVGTALTLTSAMTPGGSLTKGTSSGTLVLQQTDPLALASLTALGGAIKIGPAGGLASPVAVSTLTVSNNGVVRFLPATTTATRVLNNSVTTLSIATNTGAVLDIANHNLFLDATATPLATVQGYVTSARNGGGTNGLWTGPGLGSTFVAADKQHFGIAVASGTSGVNAGNNPVEGMILVRPALIGDANLNGAADNGDISQIISRGHYLDGSSNNGWIDGDFNLDGQVTNGDISLLLSSGNYLSGTTFSGGSAGGTSPSAAKTLTGTSRKSSSKASIAALASAAVAPVTIVGIVGDGIPDFQYDPVTGDVKFRRDGLNAANIVGEVHIRSASGQLDPNQLPDAIIGSNGLDVTRPTEIDLFRLSVTGKFTEFADNYDLGPILQAHLTATNLLTDLTLTYTIKGVSPDNLPATLTGVPEPTSLALIGLSAAGLLTRRRRTARTI